MRPATPSNGDGPGMTPLRPSRDRGRSQSIIKFAV